jgi:hypothetical protein
LVDWALPKLTDKRRLLQIMDPKLEGQYPFRAAHKACSLAYYCLNHNPKARPLMSDVVERDPGAIAEQRWSWSILWPS